ncbi:MAG: hypothetical protein ACOCTI_08165, partial [Phycisphaeraceae bacterium]
MAIPLMMLGPGGSYTTSWAVRGREIRRQAAAGVLEQQPDTETAGSFAGWDRHPGGGRQGRQQSQSQAGRDGDRYEPGPIGG